MLKPSLLRGLGAALLLVPFASAQVVERIVPEVFSPGNVVSLRGTGLSTLTTVPFFATVGGVLGTWTIDQPVLLVTDTEVLVQAPLFGNFAGKLEGGVPPGTVAGLPGWFAEATLGKVYLQGKGSTSPLWPLDKLACSFVPTFGPPISASPNFKLVLNSGPKAAPAFVLAGLPAFTGLPYAQGVIGVDLASPWVLLGPFLTDHDGDVVAPLPIPDLPPMFVAMMWYTRDPDTDAPLISNTLVGWL